MPVKLSDELVELARKEAAAAERSITAQIEHWAKLGRSVEAALRHDDVLALKESSGNLEAAFGDVSTRESVYQLLERIAGARDRSDLARTLKRGRTVFESDPQDPRGIVRIAPDGTRTRGRLHGRTFVPLAARRRARG
jgi:hypothetical protein